MSHELRFISKEVVTINPGYQPVKARMRNLGSAILLAAVQDYRSMDEEMHQHAAEFLFPQTADMQAHYDWVVAMDDGLNATWLRDLLDRSRDKWDWQREACVSTAGKARKGKEDEARKCS